MKNTRNKKFNIPTLSVLFMLVAATLFISIGYSAYSSENSIILSAQVDYGNKIRITGITIDSESTTNIIHHYNEYTNSSFSAGITLLNENSKIVYHLNITNYSEIEQGILEFTNIPDDLIIKPLNYELKTKLCDDNNKCTKNYKEILLEISYKDGAYINPNKNFDLNIGVVFKPVHKVTYKGFDNSSMFPKTVMEGSTFKLNYELKANTTFSITMNGEELNRSNYSYNGESLIVENVTGPLEIGIVSNIVATDTYVGNGIQLTIDKYADNTFVVNGYSNKSIELFVNLETEGFNIKTNRAKLLDGITIDEPKYKFGHCYKIIYTPISEVPSNEAFTELAFGLRYYKGTDLPMFDAPKMTTLSSATGVKFEIADYVETPISILSDNGLMLSGKFGISENTIFDNFTF